MAAVTSVGLHDLQGQRNLLATVHEALDVVLEWHPAAVGVERKLETLRFLAQSFARHLAHLVFLEETASIGLPTVSRAAASLESIQDEFRDELNRLVLRLYRIMPEDEVEFNSLCIRFACLLHAFDSQFSSHTTFAAVASNFAGSANVLNSTTCL